MTTDFPSGAILTESGPPPKRRRLNAWELTLWIVGAVLVAGGVLFVIFDLRAFLLANGTGGPAPSISVALIETSGNFTPPMIIGGILCIALAIFARALDLNALRRDAARAAVPSTRSPLGEGADAAPAPGESPRPAVAAEPHPAKVIPPVEATTDFTPFMRPQSDSANSDSDDPDA